MKINKSILAAVLGLSVASAQATNVYMSGSTAFRSIIYNALRTPGIVFTAAPTFTGYGGSGSGDTYMAFQGTLVGGGAVTVKCFWSGSEAGVADVANLNTHTFIADGALNGADNAGSPSGANAETATVNLAMTDTSQASSRTTTPTLTGSKIGVVTFKWVRNPGVWTGTNVTDQQLRSALTSATPIGLFTGANDDTSFVYVSGRDSGSGTRAVALGTCGNGILTPVQQIQLLNGAMTDVPVGSGNWIGDFGQSSGGTLAKSLTYNTSAAVDKVNGGAGFSVIAYLGYNDAATALAGTGGGVACTELTLNGVPFSTANIQNGTYNFWNYEYIYKANNVVSGGAGNLDAAYKVYQRMSVPANIESATGFDGLAAIKLSQMNATRPGPAGDPSHN